MTITVKPTRLYFDGNAAPGWIFPLDITIMQFPASSTAFSCGAVVNLRLKNTTIQNDDHCLFSADFSYGGNKGGAFYVNATDGSLNVFSGNTQYVSSAGLFTYGVDHQVTFTVSTGTTLKAYIDGTLVWTQTIARNAVNGGTNCPIGQEGFQFRGVYGTMRDIFVVKSELTQSDVTNIVAGTYPTLGVHYKCDEGIGQALIDSSGNKNHAIYYPSSSATPLIPWLSSGRTRLK